MKGLFPDLEDAENPVSMKVELHSHTTRYSSCSEMAPDELVSMAEACGYDALFITEHGRVWTPDELAELEEMCEDLTIFPGIEISLSGGVDLLVLGASDPIYEVLSAPHEVLAQACADGLPTIVAHPFRWGDEIPEYCKLADAVEVKTCNHGLPPQALSAEAYARANNQAPVNSSDAHGLNFLNKFWIETPERFDSPEQLRRLILSGRYVNRTRDFEMPLPPPYKAASMAELSEEDLMALWAQPAPR